MVISWSKEGRSLPLDGRIDSNQEGILIITNVQTEDSGVYICKASNTYVIVTDTMVLEIGKIPSKIPTVFPHIKGDSMNLTVI